MYVFSEDIWYYNELGEKTDYTTQIEAAPPSEPGTAYRAVQGGGELRMPLSVGETSPIRYTEGQVDFAMYLTTDRIHLPKTVNRIPANS